MNNWAKHFPSWLAWMPVIAAFAILWPHSVTLRGDDFGYVESVVATIRGEWLASSHWLEPFNFVLPVLSTAAYMLTGSFYIASYGVSGAIAIANFLLLWRWMRPALPPGWFGDLGIAAVTLTPVCLNKTVEFTGVPLGWTLTLAALLAWRARSSGWFFFAVVLGVLNRQSAVCLLALPAADLAIRWWRGERVETRWNLALVLAVGAVACVVLATPVNFARTLTAQRLATAHLLGSAEQALLGIGMAGGIAAIWAVLRGEAWLVVGRDVFKCPWPSLLWLSAGAVTLTRGVDIACETPALSRISVLIVASGFLLSAALPRALSRITTEALAAAALYTVLVAWRGIWWDYYFCDLALFLAFPRRVSVPVARGLSVSGALALTMVAVMWIIPLYWQIHWAEGSGRAYERALRAGRLTVTEISEAPFGLLGWKVFPALVQRCPKGEARLGDFVKFIEANRSTYRRGVVSILEAGPERRSLHGSGELWALPVGYEPRQFPLDDAEWSRWLQSSKP